MSALDLLSSVVNPDEVRGALQSVPAYEVNRNRLGAVVHDGLAFYDTYQQVKPAIFVAACLGFLYTGWKFETRGRRKSNAEAMWLWGTAAAACGGVAWVTRPDIGTSATVDPTTGATTAPPNGLVTFLDGRVATLSADDPNFASNALAELVAMPGISEDFQALPPIIQAVVV